MDHIIGVQMQNRISFLVIFTLMLSAPAWSGDFNSQGIKAFRSGDYQKAEQLYLLGLNEERDNSKLAAIYRNLSVLYNAQGKNGAEFAKKADELDPPITPMYIKEKDGAVLIYNNHHSAQPEQQQQQQQPFSYEKNTARRPDNFVGSPMYGGGNVYSSSTFNRSSLGATYNMNPRGGFGGILGGGSNMGTPYYYGPGYGGMNYSSVGPNGTFRYSDSTPIILPVPNSGGAIILNAPGPNIYSSKQAPDGSKTTIIMRTE